MRFKESTWEMARECTDWESQLSDALCRGWTRRALELCEQMHNKLEAALEELRADIQEEETWQIIPSAGIGKVNFKSPTHTAVLDKQMGELYVYRGTEVVFRFNVDIYPHNDKSRCALDLLNNEEMNDGYP